MICFSDTYWISHSDWNMPKNYYFVIRFDSAFYFSKEMRNWWGTRPGIILNRRKSMTRVKVFPAIRFILYNDELIWNLTQFFFNFTVKSWCHSILYFRLILSAETTSLMFQKILQTTQKPSKQRLNKTLRPQSPKQDIHKMQKESRNSYWKMMVWKPQ